VKVWLPFLIGVVALSACGEELPAAPRPPQPPAAASAGEASTAPDEPKPPLAEPSSEAEALAGDEAEDAPAEERVARRPRSQDRPGMSSATTSDSQEDATQQLLGPLGGGSLEDVLAGGAVTGDARDVLAQAPSMYQPPPQPAPASAGGVRYRVSGSGITTSEPFQTNGLRRLIRRYSSVLSRCFTPRGGEPDFTVRVDFIIIPNPEQPGRVSVAVGTPSTPERQPVADCAAGVVWRRWTIPGAPTTGEPPNVSFTLTYRAP
jgi:hypothetical protein